MTINVTESRDWFSRGKNKKSQMGDLKPSKTGGLLGRKETSLSLPAPHKASTWERPCEYTQLRRQAFADKKVALLELKVSEH